MAVVLIITSIGMNLNILLAYGVNEDFSFRQKIERRSTIISDGNHNNNNNGNNSDQKDKNQKPADFSFFSFDINYYQYN